MLSVKWYRERVLELNQGGMSIFEAITLAVMETVLFLIAIFASCLIVLYGMGEYASKVLETFEVANSNRSVSDILAVFLTVCITTVGVAFASLVKPKSPSINRDIRVVYAALQTLFSVVLCIATAVNAISFKEHFNQISTISNSDLTLLKIQALSTAGLSTVVFAASKIYEISILYCHERRISQLSIHNSVFFRSGAANTYSNIEP